MPYPVRSGSGSVGPAEEGTGVMNEQGMGAGWYTDPTGNNDPRVQRYWDGFGWTAQQTWNGAQWVDIAPGAPPPVVTQSTVPPTRRRQSGLWVGGVAALAVAGVVAAVVASSGSSHTGPGSAGARPAGPVGRIGTATHTGPVDAASANAMRAWEQAEGRDPGVSNQQAINNVEKAITTIGKDYSNQADDTTLRVDCDHLSGPEGDGSYIPTDSPDQTVNGNLNKASEYLVSASVDCDVDEEAAAGEFNKAIDYLNTATSEIKALGG
jgi:hypothetical protein